MGFAVVMVFLCQTFNKTIIYANYQINKDAITKIFCINKDKPKMQCNGKCHLKKELEKETKKDELPTNPVKEKSEFQFFSPTPSHKRFIASFVVIKYSSYFLTLFSDKHVNIILHPPIVYSLKSRVELN